MTCTIYGGYHDSTPYGVDKDIWRCAVIKEMLKHADHIVKMDGSGCEFFFRDIEDAGLVTKKIKTYLVPSVHGGVHLNIQLA